jgi:DnaJ like chaperone protein
MRGYGKKPIDPHRLFITAILKLGAVIVRVDGNVDAAKIERLKQHFSITSKSFPDAGKIFNAALALRETPVAIAREILSVTKANREFREWIVIGLCLVAVADGSYGQAEHAVIEAVAAEFGFSRADLAHILALVGIRFEPQADARQGEWADAELVGHLLRLGLSGETTLEKVKAAYHALAKKHHPDTLRARGVPIAEIMHAEDLLKNINASYAWLCTKYAA